MSKYLNPILVFIFIPIFTWAGQDDWDQKRVHKYEKKHDYEENDDNESIKAFNPKLANKAKAGGLRTSAIVDNNPDFDYFETDEKLGSGSFKNVFLAYRKAQRGKRSEEIVVLNKFKKNPRNQIGVFNYYKILKEKYGLMEVYEIFPDKWWYITKLYNGDLDNFKKIKPSLKQLDDCATDVITGLLKLKSEKLYHRDLKPPNILYRTRKNELFCVLADFDGLIYLDPSKKKYHDGPYTPEYMDPEIINKMENHEKITPLDYFGHDLYSSAISIAEFLPYTGANFKDSNTALEKIIRMNKKISFSWSKSDYNVWKNLVREFQEAFKRESKNFKNDYKDLINLILRGID